MPRCSYAANSETSLKYFCIMTNPLPLQKPSQLLARHAGCAFVLAATAMIVTPAQAAFHLWSVRELYSNNSGTVQYIEMFDGFGGQPFIGGMQIVVSDVGNTTTHTYNVPGNTPDFNTFGHALLFGTAGVQGAGGPLPDFILPNGFLFTGGGTINFFGLNSGGFGALPTGGFLSYSYPDGTLAGNSPENYAGQIGQIPEPTTAALFGAGALGLLSIRRRR
jgi:hypothetical protein